jgi:hypothetical protein
MALTDDAKAELREAVRIVREDRFEQYARTALGKHTTAPADPPKDPLVVPDPAPTDPPKDPATPPPPKPADPPPPSETVKKSAYWGELLD